MKQQTESPLYATLLYEVLHKLDITITEYFYLDMIYHLSKDGWCYKSLESVAHDMKITKNGVVKLRDRLIEKKLIHKNRKGYVKTSVMYNSVVRRDTKSYNSVTNRTTEYNAAVQLSGTKNNNRITIENNKNSEEGKGYKSALAMKDSLIRKLSL